LISATARHAPVRRSSRTPLTEYAGGADATGARGEAERSEEEA